MDTINEQTFFTVSQLTHSIKSLLEKKYKFVRIIGEISNLKTPYSGHSYFSLKDSSAQIRAVLFRQQKRFVDHDLADGQQVICFGRVTVYEPRGDYQLIIDSVELFGRGQLQIEFEKLKADLSSNGYFDQSRKKEIPKFPKRIAVISSPTGAAFHDFVKVFKLHSSPATIQLFPVRVQGNEASGEIAEAVKLLSNLADHDVLVICRGGGSLEDLWGFNEKVVADAIYNSSLPIVTGIGHEIDSTIADFCADLRCPTPTAAAESLCLDTGAVLKQVESLRNRLLNRIGDQIYLSEQKYRHLAKLLGRVTGSIKDEEHRLELSKSYLIQTIYDKLQKLSGRIEREKAVLLSHPPLARITMQSRHVDQLQKSLNNAISRIVENKEAELGKQAALLNSVSPLATLARGYSITRRYSEEAMEYKVVSTSKDVSPGDSISIMLHEGDLECTVTKAR